MQRLIQTLCACFLFFVLASCDWIGGSKVTQTNFDKIKSGKTTKQEVIDILGKPDETTSRPGGPPYWSRMTWRDDKTGKSIVIQFEDDLVLIPYFDKGDEG